MDESRRSFLEKAGKTALGLGWGLPLLNTACSEAGDHGHHIELRSETQWAMVIDVEKCQNEAVRNACVEACNVAHNIPDIPDADDEIAWLWEEEYKHVFPEQVHDHTPASVGDLPVLVQRLMDRGERIRADEFAGYWLDIGRPEDYEVAQEEIDCVVERVGDFDADNRAGIARTLHRISAIRNRKGRVVGLTCRVGRAVFGTIAIIEDLIESGRSVLLLGRPGVGKTTMLREA